MVHYRPLSCRRAKRGNARHARSTLDFTEMQNSILSLQSQMDGKKGRNNENRRSKAGLVASTKYIKINTMDYLCPWFNQPPNFSQILLSQPIIKLRLKYQ